MGVLSIQPKLDYNGFPIHYTLACFTSFIPVGWQVSSLYSVLKQACKSMHAEGQLLYNCQVCEAWFVAVVSGGKASPR